MWYQASISDFRLGLIYVILGVSVPVIFANILKNAKFTKKIAIISSSLFCFVLLLVLTGNFMKNLYHVTIEPQITQARIEDKEEFIKVPVTITNHSNRNLSSQKSIYLTYHLLDENKENVQSDNIRTELPLIEPNETLNIEMDVENPACKGNYFLEIDLVEIDSLEESVSWFNLGEEENVEIELDYE